MNKLIAVVIGQNCKKVLRMCLNSLKGADHIIYLDGGSNDNSICTAVERGVILLENPWDKEDKQMNGKQRNIYLKYLKEHYYDDWCIVLDADEVIEDISKVKQFIKEANKSGEFGAYFVKMRHFIGDFGHEDSTKEVHYVPNRLFKISTAKEYPLHSHPVLELKKGFSIDKTDCTTIWHLGHLPVDYMNYIVNRSKQHKEDSVIHDKQFLNWWENAHLFGTYPTRPINPLEIPKFIYDDFGIDYDKIYFDNRGIEFKHHLMVKQWNEYFTPESVLDVGCGRGSHMYYWNWFVPKVKGIEVSQYAIDNAFVPNIVKQSCIDEVEDFDLITCVDLLEHLPYEELLRTLANISKHGKKFLFSIPFIGDPNLELDKTHIQKMTKQQWIDLIELYGIKIKETPVNWLFANQILIGGKNEKEISTNIRRTNRQTLHCNA